MSFQIIEIIIAAAIALSAIGSLIVAIISLWISSKVKKKQVDLRQKQEELVNLQLKHHKLIIEKEFAGDSSEKAADIRVSLEGDSKKAHFIIRNWGVSSAANVNLNVDPVDGHISPLIESDVKSKLPIPRLAPGSDYKLIAAISFNSGTAFDVSWSWKETDGTEKRESSRLSL